MRRVIVTGSRNWTAAQAVEQVLGRVCQVFEPDTVLVSGACPTGADRIAETIWESIGGVVERHPADWDQHGKSAGPRRNQEMVDAGADLCLAFPLPDSRGTYDCMRRAKASGIPVLVVNEFGEFSYG